MVKAIATLTMNPAIDMSASVAHVAPEIKLRCNPPRRDPGGGGINVARAIRRLGGDAVAIYPSGGLTGQLLQDLLDREALRHQPIPIREITRENVTILDETTGQQYRFGMPGPQLDDAEWQRCLDGVAGLSPTPDYLVASGSLPAGAPAEFFAHVAALARTLGARLVLDTSGEALKQAVENGGVYLLKPNMRELSQLAGRRIEDEAHQEEVALQLVRSGKAEVVVVSLGAAGALYATREGSERLRAPTVPIQSKIGAGDSMVGGMVLSLARGDALRDAVRFGVAAGAAAVMTPGTDLCHREDVERLYRQMAGVAA